MAFVKGAPDIVLQYCDGIMQDGHAQGLTEEMRQEILAREPDTQEILEAVMILRDRGSVRIFGSPQSIAPEAASPSGPGSVDGESHGPVGGGIDGPVGAEIDGPLPKTASDTQEKVKT